MWYILIAILILILVIMAHFFQWLADLVGGVVPLIAIIIVLVVLSVFGLWPYALGLVSICLIGYIIVILLGKAGKYVGEQLEQHDKNKREIAQMNQKIQADKQMYNNDKALIEELSKNCSRLGYMSDDMWLKKLPNYANRKYSTDFKTITNNYAKQIEQQYILQNDDWFEPFKLYVLKHPGGSTVTKMLYEVNCPQLKMTHCTLDGDLVNTWLVRRTEKANKDVPPLFKSTLIKEMNESVFTPTPYLQKLYENNNGNAQEINHATEINFDDL